MTAERGFLITPATRDQCIPIWTTRSHECAEEIDATSQTGSEDAFFVRPVPPRFG
jgi:hypothetical protein